MVFIDDEVDPPLARALLPARLRPPVSAIHRFAREIRHLASEAPLPAAIRLAQLETYGQELARIEHGEAPQTLLCTQLAPMVRTYALAMQPFRDMLDASTQDLAKHRYADFAELLDYCRRSSAPLGRLLLQLLGSSDTEHQHWADAICSGLRLAALCRNVSADYAHGRVYLPQDEMRRYGVSEGQIGKQCVDEAWRSLFDFQLVRARATLLSGAPLGRALEGGVGLEVRASVRCGLRMLDKLHAARGDVFRHRPALHWLDWAPAFLHASLARR